MLWLWLGALIVVWFVIWVVWLRNWLYCKPWAWSQAMFKAVEPIELWLWDKSETILWSRFLIVLGLIPPILDQLQLFNVPAVLGVIPPKYQPYLSLVFAVLGIISEILRRATTKPLTLVAVSDKRGLSPDVAAAIESADATKREAVAVVKERRAEGKAP